MYTMSNRAWLSCAAIALAFGVGCASKPQVKPVGPAASTAKTGADAQAEHTAGPVAPRGDEPLALVPIHFDYDKSDLLEADRAVLESLGRHLVAHPERTVVISGHCDERGTVEYNIALGDRRATVAREYLVRLGVSPLQISTISYGEAQPADVGHDEAAWAKNRRDDFAIVVKKAER